MVSWNKRPIANYGSYFNAYFYVGKRLLTGYADGTLKVFDLKSGEVQHNLTKSFKQPSQILCVAAHPTRQIIASGSANGTVALFNSESGKVRVLAFN